MLPIRSARNVASRAALEREIVERVLAESDLTLLDDDDQTWRQRVLAYGTSLRLSLLRHPAAQWAAYRFLSERAAPLLPWQPVPQPSCRECNRGTSLYRLRNEVKH